MLGGALPRGQGHPHVPGWSGITKSKKIILALKRKTYVGGTGPNEKKGSGDSRVGGERYPAAEMASWVA